VQYTSITEFLKKTPNTWVAMSVIRKLYETNTKIHLCDDDTYVYGNKGLLFRQIGGVGTKIEMCWSV